MLIILSIVGAGVLDPVAGSLGESWESMHYDANWNIQWFSRGFQKRHKLARMLGLEAKILLGYPAGAVKGQDCPLVGKVILFDLGERKTR